MQETKSNQMEIIMPQLAESVVSATIAKWLKQPGDRVEEYEALCEIITDKVTAELPSTISGTMHAHLAGEGDTVDVGAAVCILLADGAAGGGGTDMAGVKPAVSEGGREPHVPAQDSAMRHHISPAVRTIADERGIDLNLVEGTGLGGRITRKDVLAYAENAGTAPGKSAVLPESGADRLPPVRSTGLHLTQAHEQVKVSDGNAAESRGEYFVDVTPVRNTIATRMRQSVSEIPHAWTMIEVDATNMVALRNRLKDDFMRKEGCNLTYLSFLIKAVVNAVKEYPIMNSVWAVDKIIVKKDINISLAVGTEEAVFMPVIKKADQKNIAGLAREIDELTKKARNGKLTLNDTQGGTFTINNTGAFGSILSQPIINYPQACNFTFESIVKKPVVIDDMIAVRSMVNLCLSLDHRILDGVICGRFLHRVKENIESYTADTKLY